MKRWALELATGPMFLAKFDLYLSKGPHNSPMCRQAAVCQSPGSIVLELGPGRVLQHAVMVLESWEVPCKGQPPSNHSPNNDAAAPVNFCMSHALAGGVMFHDVSWRHVGRRDTVFWSPYEAWPENDS